MTGVQTCALPIWLARQNQVSSEKDDAAKAEQQNAALQQQVAALQSVTGIDSQLAQRRQLVTSALSDDVAWTRLLQEIGTVIPNDVALTTFVGTKAGAGTGTATAATTSSVGSINVNAQGIDFTSAARWLLRVSALPSLTGVWLPSSSRSAGPSPVTFASTADLTPAAKSGPERSSQYLGTG